MIKEYSELSMRYARALFEAIAPDKQKAVYDQLTRLEKILEQDEEHRTFFASPLISRDDKLVVLKKALKDSGFDESILSFVYLLAQNDRLTLFKQVLPAYIQLMDDKDGVVRGQMFAAEAPSDEEKNKTQELLSEIIQKKVILDFQEDKRVMGGMVAQVGDLTFDDTVRYHLEGLKEDLNRRLH